MALEAGQLYLVGTGCTGYGRPACNDLIRPPFHLDPLTSDIPGSLAKDVSTMVGWTNLGSHLAGAAQGRLAALNWLRASSKSFSLIAITGGESCKAQSFDQ